LARRPIQALSGGQQQRVALARALAPAPRLLLLDEPLSALDRNLRAQMQEELRRLQRRTGTSFIFVTHDQDEALALSDRIAVMNAGRIEQLDRPDVIYHHPASRFVAAFVGDSNLIAGVVTGNLFAAVAGTVPVKDAPPGPCLLVVKPEDFVPAAAGLCAEVVSSSFGGAMAVVSARLPDGSIIRLHLHDTAPQPGETLFVMPRRWQLIPDAG
jgi:ABC-type Fe3+/spermidine/putrescine transport system ATPase subunit